MSRRTNIKNFLSKDVDLMVYDFDGVMTDNKVFVFQNGTEAVVVNRADGLGVRRLSILGVAQLIISTETNPVVKARARKLKLQVIASCGDKKSALKDHCRKNNYKLQSVLYVGNDLNDIKVMKIVGMPVATADAHPDIKAVAKFITSAKGGDGVIGELAELIERSVLQ